MNAKMYKVLMAKIKCKKTIVGNKLRIKEQHDVVLHRCLNRQRQNCALKSIL